MPFLADKVVTLLTYLLKAAGADEDMVDENLENTAISQVVDASERVKKIGVSQA